MKHLHTFESFLSEAVNESKSALVGFAADKIDGKIDFLLNGDYDNDTEMLKDLRDAINKFAATPRRKEALKYIENKLA